MSKTINIPVGNIQIVLGDKDPDTPGAYLGGTISSDLHEPSHPGNGPFNNAMDCIESMILAHAVAGLDVASPAYIEGIETVLDKIGNIF